MTDHDDFCSLKDEQWPKHPLEKCWVCDVIAKVREGMLAKCIAAVNSYSDETHKHFGDLFGQCRYEYGDRCDITAALRVVVDHLRALQEKP